MTEQSSSDAIWVWMGMSWEAYRDKAFPVNRVNCSIVGCKRRRMKGKVICKTHNIEFMKWRSSIQSKRKETEK